MALLKDLTRIYGTCSANTGFSVDSGGTTYMTMTVSGGLLPASNTVGTTFGSTTQRWNVIGNTANFSGVITATGGVSGALTGSVSGTTGSFSSTLSATSTILCQVLPPLSLLLVRVQQQVQQQLVVPHRPVLLLLVNRLVLKPSIFTQVQQRQV